MSTDDRDPFTPSGDPVWIPFEGLRRLDPVRIPSTPFASLFYPVWLVRPSIPFQRGSQEGIPRTGWRTGTAFERISIERTQAAESHPPLAPPSTRNAAPQVDGGRRRHLLATSHRRTPSAAPPIADSATPATMWQTAVSNASRSQKEALCTTIADDSDDKRPIDAVRGRRLSAWPLPALLIAAAVGLWAISVGMSVSISRSSPRPLHRNIVDAGADQ